jgi:hypothetical protein
MAPRPSGSNDQRWIAVAIRTVYAANDSHHQLLRLSIQGTTKSLDAFLIEFNLGSVTVGSEDWIYALSAFHDVEVLGLEPLIRPRGTV